MQGISTIAVDRGRFFAIPETLDMDIAIAGLHGSELAHEHGRQSANEQEESIGKYGSYVVILNAHVTPGQYILRTPNHSPDRIKEGDLGARASRDRSSIQASIPVVM